MRQSTNNYIDRDTRAYTVALMCKRKLCRGTSRMLGRLCSRVLGSRARSILGSILPRVANGHLIMNLFVDDIVAGRAAGVAAPHM